MFAEAIYWISQPGNISTVVVCMSVLLQNDLCVRSVSLILLSFKTAFCLRQKKENKKKKKSMYIILFLPLTEIKPRRCTVPVLLVTAHLSAPRAAWISCSESFAPALGLVCSWHPGQGKVNAEVMFPREWEPRAWHSCITRLNFCMSVSPPPFALFCCCLQ